MHIFARNVFVGGDSGYGSHDHSLNLSSRLEHASSSASASSPVTGMPVGSGHNKGAHGRQAKPLLDLDKLTAKAREELAHQLCLFCQRPHGERESMDMPCGHRFCSQCLCQHVSAHQKVRATPELGKHLSIACVACEAEHPVGTPQ